MEVLNTSLFSYDKEKKVLSASLESVGLATFPKDLTVISEYTGRTVLYTYDEAAAVDAEWWDGCEAHYLCAASNVNAKKLVLFLGNV